MSKKFIPVVIVLTAAAFFVSRSSKGSVNGDDNPKTKNQKILRNVGIMLQEGHFSSKEINDQLSQSIFKEFIKSLDPEKSIFLKSDVDALQAKYGNSIDDEIKGKELKSFYEISDVYSKRLDEVMANYKKNFAKPYTFMSNDSLQMDPKKIDFPKTIAERDLSWYKQIKFRVMDKYLTSLDDREKGMKDKGKVLTSSTGKDSIARFVYKADSTLEREARESVAKTINRIFTTRKNRETSDELFSEFVNAITNTMDPHTTYLPPIDLRTFNEGIRGSFYGIGAVLKEEDGTVKIGPMQTGMPAQKSGEIQEGDEVMKVGQGDAEPVDVTGFGVQDVVKLIRGERQGSVVKLTLRKLDRSVKVVALVRDKISIDETFAKSFIFNSNGKKIGYIYLPEFYVNIDDPKGPKASQDVANEVAKLKEDSIQGLIIDLRGNGGGSLDEVRKMVGLFIEKGPVVQVVTKGQSPKVLYDTDASVQYDGPLAVMVDQTSASASEIFAAAIQDYKRGLIIGGKSTYGKGTVQRNIPVNPANDNVFFGNQKPEDDMGSVKLTLQKFYRINGASTQIKGVTPDIVLPNKLDNIKFLERDNDYALPYDEIPPSSFSPWVSTFSINDLKNTENQNVGNSTIFREVTQKLKTYDEMADRSYPLNLQAFKKERDELNKLNKEIDTLLKLKEPMQISNTTYDVPVLQTSKDKSDKNKDFIKRIEKDLYIKQTLQIMDAMVQKQSK